MDQASIAVTANALTLTMTGLGALIVNLGCAPLLMRYHHYRGSLTRAAFLSARNDVFANIAIAIAGALTVFAPSARPNVMVGAGIMLLNIDAAREVLRTARDERQ